MKRQYLLTLPIALAIVSVPAISLASGTASLFITPSSSNVTTGQQITVDVQVNSGTDGDVIEAAKADLSYSSNLQYVSFDTSSSVFNFTVTDPSPSNNELVVTRTTTGAGYTGTAGELARFVFTATSSGPATITIDQANSDIENSSTNILGSVSGATYTVTDGSGGATPTPTPTPSATSIAAITSSSTPTPTTTATATSLPVTGSSAAVPLFLLLLLGTSITGFIASRRRSS